jgi:CheY-like chemotaxis protein
VGGVSNRIKVVYIEDNQANLQLVVRALEATGRYEVLGALDGDSGLQLVEAQLPDVVLVDLDVPGTNGFEVARQMKASANPAVARIPIAAVSANVLADERGAALAAGCVAFVEKPFDIHRLRELVAELAGAGAVTV